VTLGRPRRTSRAEHVLDLAAGFARPHDGLHANVATRRGWRSPPDIEERDLADGLSGVDALAEPVIDM
jgi:hypothetical protein